MKLLAAVAAALVDVPAAAQEAPDSARARRDSTEGPVYAVPRLVVSVPRPIATAGGASAVVIRVDSLGVPAAPSLEQVLRELPLIQIRANSRGEAQPALRGAEDRQIAVVVDGIPITLGWDHRTDLSIIPLTSAREVRLVRGLPSLLSGPNALGGTVDIDVARGGLPTAADAELGVTVDHVGGRSASLTGGGSSAAWRYRAGLGYRQRPGFPTPSGAVRSCLDNGTQSGPCGDDQQALLGDALRLNSDLTQIDAFLASSSGTAPGPRLSLMMTGFRAERGVPPETHTAEPRLWRYPLQQRLLATLSAATGRQATEPGGAGAELALGLDAGATDIDEFATSDYDSPIGGERDRDRTLTARLSANTMPGAGFDVRAAATYADVTHHEVLRPGGAADYRQRLSSLAGELEWSGRAAGTAALRSTIGLALDAADTPESADKPALGSLTDWAARLGVTAGLSESLVLHGALSRRARFPSLRELYSGALGRFEPNPGLRPEVLTAGEAGVTAGSGAWRLQTVAFHHRLSGAIERIRVDAGGDSKFQRVNRGEIRSTGVEVLGSWAAPLGTTLSGDATLQRVRLMEPGAGSPGEPEYEPALAGRLGVSAPLAPRLAAAADLRYVGRQKCVSPDTPEMLPVPASTVADASLRAELRLGRARFSRLSALLAVDNVADSAVFDQCGLPQPGRTLRLQIRLR